jgi:hypothetical protein
MSNFDFLDSLGESASNFKSIETSRDDAKLISLLQILVSRGLMMEEFKNELLDLYLNKKINLNVVFQNIEKSIQAHEAIEYKLIGIDKSLFKKFDSSKEYVGAIDRLPNDESKLNSDRGKVSFQFAEILLEHLKGRVMNIKLMNNLCDALDFNVKVIFNKEILTAGVITSKS